MSYIAVLLFFSLLVPRQSVAQDREFFSGLPGKSFSENSTLLKSKNFLTYRLDDSVSVAFICDLKNSPMLYEIVCLMDTVVFVSIVKDLKFYDEVSQRDTTYADAARLAQLNGYFKRQYGMMPDFSSLPLSYIDIQETFGLHCGAAGSPTPLGIKFIELQNRSLTENDMKQLLLSLNPNDRLFGLLLFNKDKHPAVEHFFNKFKTERFRYQYCSGCGGAQSLTVAEILKEVK
jgi:hypothetical protein